MTIDMKQIKDTNAFSCVECGKCTGVCPVSRYSADFSPRSVLIHALRNSHPDAFNIPELWACLSCGQCNEVCPWDIRYSSLVQILRGEAGFENSKANCSHGGILQSISRIMSNDALKQNRLDWLSKKQATSSTSEYLYFVGCLPYFDALFSDLDVEALTIARNTLKILNYFDIKPQILADEKCCGHDFFWNGDLLTYKKLAEANYEMLKKSGAKKIITSCPECFRTIKTDYTNLFGKLPFKVMHISEFISSQFSQNKLSFSTQPGIVTFQDPCRLGRHSGIYDAPRQALQHIDGLELKEMAHHHKRATC